MRNPVFAAVLVAALAGCVRTATHFPLIQPRRILSGYITWDDGVPRPWTIVTLVIRKEPVASARTDLFGRYRFDIPWTEQWEVWTDWERPAPDTAPLEPIPPPRKWIARPGEAVR